jgi:thiamine-monophosphate kinase
VIISDCSERELVARIQRHLAPPPDWLLVGIGDDAAVVEPARNRVEVLTVDAIVEGVHFDRAFVSPDAIGHRALAVNLSDLAAMGAAPRLALLSMVLPPDLPLDHFDGIAAGFARLAAKYGLHVAGGNLTRSPGPLVIDVTVIGTVKRRQALTRAGALPGDDLYVSGPIGSAAAGLLLLQEENSGQSAVGSRQSAVSSRETVSGYEPKNEDSGLRTAYLRPEPRVRLGMLLSRNRAASACIDLSDGLADAVHRIAGASGIGAVIDAAAVPIAPGARACFERRGLDAITTAITSGDDYELLLAVRPRAHRRLSAAAHLAGAVLTRIGRCQREPEVVLQRPAGAAIDRAPLPHGYSHFRPVDAPRVVPSDVEGR